jgi:hypothetical protein
MMLLPRNNFVVLLREISATYNLPFFSGWLFGSSFKFETFKL